MKRTEISYEIIDVSDITNVRFYTSVDQGSYIPPHWHRAVEIIYMQEGSLDITVKSRSFTIHPGDCTLINANVLHSTKCTNPNKAIVLQIPLDFMEKYIPNVQQLLFQLYHNFSVKVFQSDLISTTDSVHVILERHGFTNYKLFRQMFQEHFRDTPTQIRRNYQKSEVSTSAM